MRSAHGSISQLSPGRWRISVEAPPDPDTGKRRRVSKVIRGSRRDAAIALGRLGGCPMPDDVTWNEYYATDVEPTFSNLADKTAYEYRRLWRVELSDRIGRHPVSRTDWHLANSVLTSIGSPTVQRSAGRLLKKMCNMAIRSGLLTVNPVDRAIEYAPHRKRRKRLVAAQDVRRFMDAVEGLKYEPLLLLELGAGLRPEEARALLWEDVSPYVLDGVEYCAVDVNKALTVVGNEPRFKDTKNEASARIAVCGEPFASRILYTIEGRTGPICASGRPYSANKPEAWYTSPVTVAHNWKQWCRRNGVEHVTDENLRSSYATMMGEAMAPDSVVSGNMGHSDGTTKGAHYQTVTMRAKCGAARMLAEYIGRVAT